MSKRKEIWLPVSETKVQVVNGEIKVWDEMTMALRPISKETGFKAEK